jgi:ribosomal protein L40E
MSGGDSCSRRERDMVARLRASAKQARAVDRSELLEEAAKELEMLYICIDCYAASSAAACREIRMLKDRLNDAAT